MLIRTTRAVVQRQHPAVFDAFMRVLRCRQLRWYYDIKQSLSDPTILVGRIHVQHRKGSISWQLPTVPDHVIQQYKRQLHREQQQHAALIGLNRHIEIRRILQKVATSPGKVSICG